MKPPPSAPPAPWKLFSTLAQSSGARQVPSLPDEEVQPAASPVKPRAAAFGGYLLVAAPALATIPRPRMASEAATVAAIRRGSEESIGAPHSVLFAPNRRLPNSWYPTESPLMVAVDERRIDAT